MALPLKTNYAPMDALAVADIPDGRDWQYEPKWDGFRCLVFRDRDKIDLQSKKGQPLARYFPELVDALRTVKAPRFILDGEILIPIEGGALSFDDLLQRIHPAPSRIRKLSVARPATLVVFDLLADEKGKSLVGQPLSERRKSLESFARRYLKGHDQIILSPATRDIGVARRWLSGTGATLDGIIAKKLDASYQSGNRDGMMKIKRLRSADCVVGGFRYGTNSKLVGSLLLGLYDDAGLLDHVGFCSTIKATEKAEVTKKLEKLIKPPGFTGQAPGGPSRWSTTRSTEWQPLDPRLVVEVQYDHFTNGRFRHGTKFLRWRPDKSPRQCTMKQVEQESRASPLKFAG